jgi:predicted DNA-binding protein YlxM (UPF0122 family)
MHQLKHLILGNTFFDVSDDQIVTAINNLPVENQRVITLHFLENITRKEIANQLNWSASKVHNRITRGITLLKAELNPGYFDQMRQLATTLYNAKCDQKTNSVN